MNSNSITSSAPSLSKESGKKKKTNRLAKLKQCKLEAKREQWLSQVKNKVCKDESKVGNRSPSSPLMLPHHERDEISSKDLEIRSRGEDSSLNDSYLEYLINSPISSVSESQNSSKNHGLSSSRSSSCSCDETVSDEEDDDCVDDWEAVADALAADEDKNQNPNSKPPGSDTNLGNPNNQYESSVPEPEFAEKVPKLGGNGRAWRPDDACRPQNLPNLIKQNTFPMNSERRFGHGGVNWGCHPFTSQPSSCPICCEDLDLTDTSFLPCLCGFRLCLFCHKRIVEDDGRCPGCRKKYDSGDGEATAANGNNGGTLQFRSMSTR